MTLHGNHRQLPWVLLALALSPACAPAMPLEPASGTALGVNAAAEALTIRATDFAFSPRSLQVPAGRPVTLTLENHGSMQHDWRVADLGVSLGAKAGEASRATFTFARPGTYAIACSIPTHADFGMTGQLVVTGDPAAHVQALPEPSTSLAMPIPPGTARLPLPAVAPVVTRTSPTTVPVTLTAREVTALVTDGVAATFWTFGGTVPGPMIRVRQGDTVDLTLENPGTNQLTHAIDLHAVSGPGGGGMVTGIPPGGRAEIRFLAQNPGVFVYHCASPKVACHIANGMYGLIVVEPPGGFGAVDREFYVMQGELYLQGERTAPGLRPFDYDKLLAEQPDFVVFNGGVGALSGDRALHAHTGERLRVFFGVGGPNLASSAHIMGAVFDTIFPMGALEALHDVQTALVPPGSATRLETHFDVPGSYMLTDHSLERLEKGALAAFVVDGKDRPDVFQPVSNDPGDVDDPDGQGQAMGPVPVGSGGMTGMPGM